MSFLLDAHVRNVKKWINDLNILTLVSVCVCVCAHVCSFESALIPGNFLDKSLQFSFQGFSEVSCPCLLPRADRWAQSPPADFVLKAGLILTF